MALQKQRLSFPLVGGLDTKTADPHVQPTKVLSLENCVFEKVGQVSKREGVYGLPLLMHDGASKSRLGKNALYTHKDELLMPSIITEATATHPPSTDGPFMLSVDRTANKYARVGRFSCCRISSENVVPAGYVNGYFDMAYNGGYRCYVWMEFILGGTPYSYCTIVDEETGLKVVDKYVLGPNGDMCPRVESVGDSFHIFTLDPANQDIYLTIVDTATPTTFSAESAVITDLVAASTVYDTCTAIDAVEGDVSVVAYKRAGQHKLFSFKEDGSTAHTYAAAVAIIDAIGISRCYDRNAADYVLVLMYQLNATNEVSYRTFTEELGAIAGPTALFVEADHVQHFTCIEDPGYDIATPANSSAMMFYDTDDTTNQDVKAVPLRFTGAAAAIINILPNAFLQTKAFVYDNIVRVGVRGVDQSSVAQVQPTFFIVHQYSDSLSTHTYAPWCWHTDAAFSEKTAADNAHLSSVREFSGGIFETALPSQDRLPTPGVTVVPTTIGSRFRMELDRGATSTDVIYMDTIHTETETHIGGGLAYSYDGSVQEHGFLMAPSISTVTDVAVGGNIPNGTYLYCCVYEWTDKLGQLHRSAPSVPVSHTNAAGTGTEINTVNVKPLPFGEHWKSEVIYIRVFRTAASGTVYYNTGAYAINDRTVASQAIADDAADATITVNESLYTTGGVLANYPPPAWTIGCLWGERLVVISDQNKRTAWISKPKVAANLGWEFSDETPMRIISPADLTAAAVMDGNLYLFTADDILQVYGTPPDSFGNANLKTRVVSHEVGCSEAGVVNTDKGLVFKSKRGIYLLGRSLQAEYIGAAVDDYNADTITDVIKVPKKNLVVFRRSGNEDKPLVYDYLMGQWSTFDFSGNDYGVRALALHDDFLTFQGHYLTGGVHYWAIFQQDGTVYRDNGYNYFMKWRSAWVKTSGLQGFQRLYWIYLLAEYVAPCVLTVNVYYDYSDTASQSITWTVDAVAGADVPLQLRIKPELQKCQAVSVEVVESAPSSTFESVKFSGLDLVIGVKGKTPLKASKSA